jgi:hypothetical protein
MRLLLALAAPAITLSTWAALQAEPNEANKAERPGITLLGTLEDWKYPGIKMPRGAQISDGGFSGIQSAKLQAVFTTPDSFEKVVSFYENKFGVTAEGKAKPAAKNSDDKPSEPQSVITQDDSKDRPLAMRVFVVNRADTSTTIVVSRATGEKETHIAWSEFIRIR